VILYFDKATSKTCPQFRPDLCGGGQVTGRSTTTIYNNIDSRYNHSYTFSMKTAISIPDSIFQAAENLAQRLGLSRSELYVKAMSEYLNSHKNQNVTKKLNEIYASNNSNLDNEILSMQIHSIPKEDWE